MKNTKFAIKLICAILPVVLLIIYTALFPNAYMDNEYPAWKYTKYVTSGKIDALSSDGPTSTIGNSITNTTLIIGDSRGMADLKPELMSYSTINLAVGGATSIEMYYTLRNYINNVGTPKNVVIMFAPFHYSVIDNFWTRSVYFNYFSIPELYEIYNSAHASNSETLLQDGYFDDLVSYRLYMPNKYLPALTNAKFFTRNSINNEIYMSLHNSRGNAEFGHDNGNSDMCYETTYSAMHRTGDAVLLDMYLNRLIKLCIDNNIETVIAMPPMNESSFNALNPSYIEDFNDYMNSISAKYPEIKVKGDLIYMEDKYFGDSSHLNSEGASEFTKFFINYVN